MVELAPGVHGPARDRRPVRGPGQGGPAGPAVRVHPRRAAGRGGPDARLLRPDPLALLAVRPGRLAGQGRAGACRWCTPRTPWPRSRTRCWPTATAPSRWPGSSARSRSSPRPTGWSPTPPTRPSSCVDLLRRRPDRVVTVVPPGVDLDLLPPRPTRSASRAAAARACLPDAGACSLFVGRIQPLKAPDVLLRAAAELRRADPELAATGCTVVDRRRPERVRAGPADRAASSWPPRSASPTSVRFLPPLAGADLRRRSTGRPTWSRCPATTSRSGWSRWRRRPAAPRSSRPPSAGWSTAVRDGVSGLLVDGARPGRLGRA